MIRYVARGTRGASTERVSRAFKPPCDVFAFRGGGSLRGAGCCESLSERCSVAVWNRGRLPFGEAGFLANRVAVFSVSNVTVMAQSPHHTDSSRPAREMVNP